MKVDGAKAASARPTSADGGNRPKSSNPFSGVLQRKADVFSKKTAQQGGQFPSPNETSSTLPPMLLLDGLQASGAAEHASTVTRSEPAVLQSLVQEIAVMSKPDGENSVEIQFNSKTLEGLHVQIAQDQNRIAIHFSTASQQVSELLSRNLGQLSAALHSKGLETGPIQVELAPAAPNALAGSAGSGDKRREPTDGRRQRQRQK